MAMQFDFLIVGEDEASLCAAACAAEAGARTGLVRSIKARSGKDNGAIPNIPNFIWRRLNLHEYEIALEPVSAHVTLFETGDAAATYAGRRETKSALSGLNDVDGALWEDFVDEINALGDGGFVVSAASGAPAPNMKLLTELLADARALNRTGQLVGSCDALLDDYFEDGRLKTHIAAHALASAGLGGSEPGSALNLVEYLDENSWRVRSAGGRRRLRDVLDAACRKAGVTSCNGTIKSCSCEGGKYESVFVEGEGKLKTRYLFFATPDAAAKSGAARCAPGAEIRGGAATTATMRLTLSEKVAPPSHDADAIFQIVDQEADLQEARDAALGGRLPEKLPVEFEFAANGDVIARTAYCPSRFYEDGEWRAWASQDRQAIGARIKERLSSRISGLNEAVSKTEIEIAGVAPDIKLPCCDGVIVQPKRHNAIGAAVALIDRIMASDR